MANSPAASAVQRALTVLAGTVVGVVVVACLYWVQAVFIPVALAIFLTFLLTPLVTLLERGRLGRTPSVILVVLLAGSVLAGVGWLIAVEVAGLAQELPSYSENIREKVTSLRGMSEGGGVKRLERMTHEIAGASEAATAGEASVPGDESAARQRPTPVVIQPETPTWLSRLPALLRSAMESLGGVALAIVLLIFMLLEREALRNRVFRLVGHGRVTMTTKAVDDAAHRVSRYLLMQLVINSVYGSLWALGLFIVGVDYALLWGFLSAILRYVPYVGAPVAALFPVTLSLAEFPGWWPPLEVIGLFLLLELVTANVAEPFLYGQSIGVSPVAMLVAAAFWAFLWGPIGLVLSGPLTVCLVVLGKHVPQLEFFSVLLGDEPALEPDVSYYQRLLARDQDEASRLIVAQGKSSSPEAVYDELMIPALHYTKRDRDSDELTDEDEQFVFQATQEILDEVDQRLTDAATESAAEDAAQQPPARTVAARARILACPARDEADRLALEMLKHLLDPEQWEVEITAVETLTAELVERAAEQEPAMICIGALPPGGLAHTRYLCKRLRARFPKVKIAVGRFGLKENLDENREQLETAGADLMATTLLEMQTQLSAWLPVLTFEETKAATG